MTHKLAAQFTVTAPGWLLSEQSLLPTTVVDPDERMRIVNRLAARNIQEGTGGPFAALVVDRNTNEILAAGVNLVLHAQLAAAHAEVVTLGFAQSLLGEWNLGSDRETLLVVNAQPCVMCLGTLIWSGISALEYAASGSDVEAITGFDEGPVPADWIEQLAHRKITVESGRSRDAALSVLHEFRERVESGTTVLYNGG